MRLDKHKFAGWLRTKPPETIVGKHRSPSCPIANFYSETCGGAEIVIFERIGEGYFIDRGYDARLAPQWASRFIWLVDDDENGKITARRALEMLAE